MNTAPWYASRWFRARPLALMNRTARQPTLRDLEYALHPRQKLDLYLTPKALGTVMFVHGGYWDSGDKGHYSFMADALCRLGFNAALINYRLAPEHVFPDFVTDAALALKWLELYLERCGASRGPLFVMGHSAGAHSIALLCCTDTHLGRVGMERCEIRGAIGLSGPYDFLDWLPGDARMQLALGSEPTRWPDTQPVLVADGLNPPLLLLHGQRDNLCTPMHAPALRDAVVARGGPAEYRWYPGLDHYTILGAFSPLVRWLEPNLLRDVRDFLMAHA